MHSKAQVTKIERLLILHFHISTYANSEWESQSNYIFMSLSLMNTSQGIIVF